ncbi:MAG: ABC transporter permease [Pseudomonadota bacterium]|nr:ABC transporter permease [Pseudomonadota bacterium]
MEEMRTAAVTALNMVLGFDARLAEIVLLSLQVSLTAVALATSIGFPLGAAIAITRFPGRRFLMILMSALMGLPPVVVGLTVYLLLSRSGPLGEFGLLFRPTAMVIAQCILVTPIIAALSRQVFRDLWEEYQEQLRSLGASRIQALRTLLWEGRYRFLTVVLAGFGRAVAEVGAVLIVGGNIAGETRVMTTTIVLETARGDLALALAIGFVLIFIVLMINAAVYFTKDASEPFAD